MIHFMIKLAVRRAYIDRFASYSWTKSHKLCTITPLSCFYCSGICNFFIFVLFFAIKCKWIQLYFLFLEYLSHLNILFSDASRLKAPLDYQYPLTLHKQYMQQLCNLKTEESHILRYSTPHCGRMVTRLRRLYVCAD